MSGISGVGNFGTSALNIIQQLSARTANVVDRVSSPDASGDVTDFAAAIMEMGELQLQTKAAVSVLHTTHTLAQELMSLPRK